MLGANLSQCGRTFEEKIVAVANREEDEIVTDKQKKSNLRHHSDLEFSVQFLRSIRRGTSRQIAFKCQIDDKSRRTMRIVTFTSSKTLFELIEDVFVHSIIIVSLNQEADEVLSNE